MKKLETKLWLFIEIMLQDVQLQSLWRGRCKVFLNGLTLIKLRFFAT
jgi:hypothetical protein